MQNLPQVRPLHSHILSMWAKASLLVMVILLGCGDETSGTPPECVGEDCTPDFCGNGVLDAIETDVDCGGELCAPCDIGKRCISTTDCESGLCPAGRCLDPNAPEPSCTSPDDCSSGICLAGQCQPSRCDDERLNGSETDVDCGGLTCDGCALGLRCEGDSDCASDICLDGFCRNDRCGDGQTNGDEVCDDGNRRDGDTCSADCSEVTCRVGADLLTIQDGLSAGCPVIVLGAGEFSENLVIEQPVELVGQGAEESRITASGIGSVVDVRSTGVILSGLSVSGGEGPVGAGIKVAAGAELLIQNGVVENNLAYERGAGILVLGQLSMVDSVVRGNRLEGSTEGVRGAGIFAESATLDFENVEIRENTIELSGVAESSGAGLYVAQTQLGAEGLSFDDNAINVLEAPAQPMNLGGAAMAATASQILVPTGFVAAGNVIGGVAGPGSASGVGIWAEESNVVITEGLIQSTQVTVDGINALGVAIAGSGELELSGLTIETTTVTNVGALSGVIYWSGKADISNVYVREVVGSWSLAESLGLYIELVEGDFGAPGLNLIGSDIASNSLDGGVLRLDVESEDATAFVQRSSVAGPVAGFVSAGADLLLDFENSTVAAGIGLVGPGGAVVRLRNATVVGGLQLDAGQDAQLANSIIDSEQACVAADGAIVSLGFNLFTGTGCPNNNDLVVADANLLPLAYVDSETATFEPEAFSLAVNAGNPTGCTGIEGEILTVDQRGELRENRCDIGAHER